jgi:hypothetical protein
MGSRNLLSNQGTAERGPIKRSGLFRQWVSFRIAGHSFAIVDYEVYFLESARAALGVRFIGE